MTASGNKPVTMFGYLAFVDTPHGIVGGYLIVDVRARPAEFHCTAPVSGNRTQEILFGETWRRSLLSDAIGTALLKQSTRKTQLLLTDESDAIELRQSVDIPMALFVEEDAPGWSFQMGSYSLTTSEDFERDREQVRDRLRLMQCPDLFEPLDRIRNAIQEAQRSAA